MNKFIEERKQTTEIRKEQGSGCEIFLKKMSLYIIQWLNGAKCLVLAPDCLIAITGVHESVSMGTISKVHNGFKMNFIKHRTGSKT